MSRYAILLILICLPILAAGAEAWQAHARIEAVAREYIQSQLPPLNGKQQIEIGELDARTQLRACEPLEAFLPSGAQLIGKTRIGVRCTDHPGWSVFLQANIRIRTQLLVTRHPLSAGIELSMADLSTREGELGQVGLLTDPAQAIGKTLKFALASGQVLRQSMLRAPYVVKQGQDTEVRLHGEGYMVRSSGQALNNGAENQAVRVRMTTGQVLSGLASRDGSVEIRQ